EATLEPLSTEQKKRLQTLIDTSATLQDLVAAIDKEELQGKDSKQLQALSAMKDVLKQKITYLRELDRLCKAQNPPVDQLLQEIFVTSFDAPSLLGDLIDADATKTLFMIKNSLT
ncbi:MAG TPA: hypothetical protein VN457_07780, partial [Chlamydiales bacterium]|nr:hypothetical protein [Chlamydiales bacterium]